MRYACVDKILMNESLKAKMKVKQNRQVNHPDTCVSAKIMFPYFLFFFFLLRTVQVTKNTFSFAADTNTEAQKAASILLLRKQPALQIKERIQWYSPVYGTICSLYSNWGEGVCKTTKWKFNKWNVSNMNFTLFFCWVFSLFTLILICKCSVRIEGENSWISGY